MQLFAVLVVIPTRGMQSALTHARLGAEGTAINSVAAVKP